MEPETPRDFKKPLDEPILPDGMHVLEGKHTTEARRGLVARSRVITLLRVPDHREIIQVREQTDELENVT